jgi:glutamyl-tRNA synthetase
MGNAQKTLGSQNFPMTVRVRLAPSPTGTLHIGTARTAVFNWLFARHHGGTFILRIEDTDLERSKPEFTQNILDGLTWLGLAWDEGPSFQSQRMELYRQKVQELLDKGFAYRAYDTPEELDAMREAQKARNEAPRYDNRHRTLTPEQETAFRAEGRKPVIRFKIDDDREISWTDLVRGTVTWKGRDLGGDMVIARAAEGDDIGQPLYNFVVVVDDIDMQMTHIIRGEDHIGNTPKQILLYEALGEKVPEFGHAPLILSQDGAKLSKRNGVTSISDFQRMGYTAEALVNYMTLLGWSPPEPMTEIFTLSEAAEKFSFDRVNKAGAKFDWDKLNWLNGQYIHVMPVEKITELLIPYWQAAGYEFDPQRDRAWLEQIAALVAPSLARLDEAVDMARYLFKPLDFTEDAKSQLQQEGSATAIRAILESMDSATLTEAMTQDLIKQVVKDQNLKKGVVMKALRAALTGALQGPDLVQSWLILNQRGLDRDRFQQALTLT